MKRSPKYVFDLTVVLALKVLMRVVAYFWPRDRRLIACGAWMGDRYCDGPRFLAEYLLEHTDYTVVWIGKPHVREKLPMHPRMRFVEIGSGRAFLVLLRAKIWVCCIHPIWDLTTWPIEGRAKLFNTWHGYGIKRIGNKTGKGMRNGPRASFAGRIASFLQEHPRFWLMVGGEQDVRARQESDPAYLTNGRFLRIGTPTNDFLLSHKDDRPFLMSLKRKYARLCGFSEESKIVTFFPTWRNAGDRVFAFYNLPEDTQRRWRAVLERYGAVLVEKHHPRTLSELPQVKPSLCSIPISAERQGDVDVHELLLISDILISDYSGACQDFGVLQRPCLLFAYDLEEYMKDCSGFVDGWENALVGPIVRTEQDLLDAVERNLKAPSFSPTPGFAETVRYQTGHCCEKVVELMKGL